MSLFKELRRRNVFRVTIAYVVSAWLLAQVADLVLDNIGAPPWVMQSILLVLALGLAPVIFFSWAFEVTPEGIRRESEIDRSTSITHITGRKLDRAITIILAVALAYFAIDKFFLTSMHATTDATTAPATAYAANTIAVLPFVNMSDDKANEYFSDGLSEELLNVLAKNPNLQVAARTSSFSLKGEKLAIGDVAERLNVAHVLEGSVRMSGDQMRITAQLIRGDNGYHLWSETYDRKVGDIFKVQDEIAARITDALLPHIVGNGETTATRASDYTPPADAYQTYLLARDYFNRLSRVGLLKAYELMEQLVRQHPEYAEAQAFYAHIAFLNTNRTAGTLPWITAEPVIRRALDRALDRNPNLPEAYLVEGHLKQRSSDYGEAIAFYEKAIELSPSYAEAWRYLSDAAGASGDDERSWQALETARKLDPISPGTLSWVFRKAMDDDRAEMADDALQMLRKVAPETTDDLLLHHYISTDQLAKAAVAMEQFRADWPDADPHDHLLAETYARLGLLDRVGALDRITLADVAAEQGDDEAALAIIEEESVNFADPHDRADNYWSVYLALGRYEVAEAVLSDLWYGYAGEELGPKMDFADAWMLILLLQHHGKAEEAESIIDKFLPIALAQGEDAQMHIFLLQNRLDDAMALLMQQADNNEFYTGYTRTSARLFLLEDHPDYPVIEEKLQKFRAAELVLYEEMKAAQ